MAQQVDITLNYVLLKLLDWPFLLFLGFVLFTIFFYGDIAKLFNRGDISLSWGDRSIRLRELSDNLDKEFDPIREEIEAIKEMLQSRDKTPESQQIKPLVTNNLSSEQLENARRRIQEALRSGKYRWRSIERLAVIGGISESQTLDILRSDPEVIFSMGKSGRQIARLKSR
jgi:hypothetical protein